MIISFVILHYENIEDTIECIDSILNLNSKFVRIIVVDNGSLNNKVSSVKSHYQHLKNITFLYSQKNLGFSKGNNIGYLYAKKKFKSDCIVLCNNDLVFKQKDFVEKLKDTVQYIDVAGPKIISTVDGKNQNPVPNLFPTINSVRIALIKFFILYCLSFFGADKFFRMIFAKKVVELKKYECIDYQLHGACLIFGPNYINRFDGLYEDTFMYMEESILKWRCNLARIKMEYIPELEVLHKEGSSTEKIYGKGRKKRMFYYRWNLDGCKKLIYLIEHGENS